MPELTRHALVAFAVIMGLSTVAELAGWIPWLVSATCGVLAGFCLLLAFVSWGQGDGR